MEKAPEYWPPVTQSYWICGLFGWLSKRRKITESHSGDKLTSSIALVKANHMAICKLKEFWGGRILHDCVMKRIRTICKQHKELPKGRFVLSGHLVMIWVQSILGRQKNLCKGTETCSEIQRSATLGVYREVLGDASQPKRTKWFWNLSLRNQ